MNKYSFLLISAFGLLSCHDDLFQDPVTAKVSSNFFKTEIEIEEAVTGVYATLQRNGLYNLYLPAIT